MGSDPELAMALALLGASSSVRSLLTRHRDFDVLAVQQTRNDEVKEAWTTPSIESNRERLMLPVIGL